jgi:hypothetical protein
LSSMKENDGILSRFNGNLGASSSAIIAAEQALGEKLPADYVKFLQRINGGEGFVGKGAYAMLWRVEELFSMNLAYDAEQHSPGVLLFGSDGGGEAFGFDTRSYQWPIVQVPFIGMDWNAAIPMGDTFDEFLQRLSEIE